MRGAWMIATPMVWRQFFRGGPIVRPGFSAGVRSDKNCSIVWEAAPGYFAVDPCGVEYAGMCNDAGRCRGSLRAVGLGRCRGKPELGRLCRGEPVFLRTLRIRLRARVRWGMAGNGYEHSLCRADGFCGSQWRAPRAPVASAAGGMSDLPESLRCLSECRRSTGPRRFFAKRSQAWYSGNGLRVPQ